MSELPRFGRFGGSNDDNNNSHGDKNNENNELNNNHSNGRQERKSFEQFKADRGSDAAHENYLNDFISDDDEENELILNKDEKYSTIDTTNIEARLAENLKRLRELHPSGGLKSFQFVTSDILIDAPEDYFIKYEKTVENVTQAVQAILADKGMSDLVSDAGTNQRNEELQDKAFRVIHSIATEQNMPFRGIEKSLVIYMATMDIIGFSRIDPLWRNKEIDEIICNGPDDIQIEIRGKLIKVPSCRFRSPEALEALLERIFLPLNKVLSRTTPLLNGRLYDNSRIFASDRIVTPEGPNVAIRRHRDKYWSPLDYLEYGSASKEMLLDVGNMINKGCSYIVIGGTGSGKTSLLNATSGFFDPMQRILTLEEDLELKLNPNKNVGAPMECLDENPNKPGSGISMRDLVKASLRMRPDGIIIGEVRDGAMYDLCQALNTGHWGASTVHANSPFDGIYRMQSLVTQSGLVSTNAALPLIAAAFDFIIMVEKFPEDGSRKITSVSEIAPYPTTGDDGQLHLDVVPLWEFEPDNDRQDGQVSGEWVKKNNLSDIRTKRRYLNLTKALTWEDLEKLCKI